MRLLANWKASAKIYYYHNEDKPILLLLIYAKADQENMTGAQKVQLKKHVDAIIDEFG